MATPNSAGDLVVMLIADGMEAKRMANFWRRDQVKIIAGMAEGMVREGVPYQTAHANAVELANHLRVLVVAQEGAAQAAADAQAWVESLIASTSKVQTETTEMVID